MRRDLGVKQQTLTVDSCLGQTAPMKVVEALLESWDRQARIVDSMATLVNERNRKVRPTKDTWELDMQLCHIHETRYWWLGQTNKVEQAKLGDVIRQDGEDWVAVDDLGTIRTQLTVSAQAVRDTFTTALAAGDGPLGPYDHPVLFLQHMLWHEGWHVGLVRLGLAAAGEDPTDEWEQKHVWELWRGVEE